MQLERRKLTLSTGETASYEYDAKGDVLEIVAREAEATGAIELTESIILRFDWASSEPLSLSFISLSKLVQPGEYGKVHFQLLVEEWPAETQDEVLAMLREASLAEFLTLSSYAPAHTYQIIPMATIKPPQLATLAA